MDFNGHDEECWEYLDPRSVKRGPFKGAQMAAWHDHKYLPEDLEVRHNPAMNFVTIRELFHPPMLPFRSRPRLPQAATAATAAAKEAPAPVVAKDPQSGAQAAALQNLWQYRDRRGMLQGPFSSVQMAQWHEHNMLPHDLALRRTVDANFSSISRYFPPPAVPFVSPPVDPAAEVPKPQPMQPPVVEGFRPDLVSLGLHRPPPTQAAPKAKSQAKAENNNNKGGRGAKANATPDANAAATVEQGGKAKGRGKNSKQQQQQQQQQGWNWAENNWNGTGCSGTGSSEAWWESSWWGAGWNEGNWDQDGQKGADWKGGESGAAAPKEKADKNMSVQAVFGSLRWGPHTEAADLFPEGVLRKVLDEGIVWEERWVSPLAVRFSQGKIHPFFHERGPICEVMLQIRCKEDAEGGSGKPVKRIEPPFPPIRLLHLKQQGVLVTLDNRRLYALQRYALQEWPSVCVARALCVDELTPTRLRAENRKFTNRVCGLQLEVESRSNAFDTFSWVTEAARLEAARFCRPIAFRAADKALSLLPMLVVHAMLCPRIKRLLWSRWPLLSFLAGHLPNTGRRRFSSKWLLMTHVLELARPGRTVVKCPAVCVGYKSETVVSLSKGKSCVTSKLSLLKPMALLGASSPVTTVQREILAGLLPLMCVPYARHALKGETRDWVVSMLLAWGKVGSWCLQPPDGP